MLESPTAKQILHDVGDIELAPTKTKLRLVALMLVLVPWVVPKLMPTAIAALEVALVLIAELRPATSSTVASGYQIAWPWSYLGRRSKVRRSY